VLECNSVTSFLYSIVLLFGGVSFVAIW